MFRRAYIKRRLRSTGQFESDWVEITDEIKRWGTFTTDIDSERFNRFKFSSAKITVKNDEGLFNPEDDENSLWFGYAARARSLLQVRAGFIEETVTSGIWTQTKTPRDAPQFDIDLFDDGVIDDDAQVVFTGIITGDIPSSSKNEVVLTAAPLNQVFRDFPAQRLNFFTTTGLSASQFVQGLRDMTDGAGSFVFRPFFYNTTTGFNFTATSNIYQNLNTSGAKDIVDKDVWSTVEKLSEAEGFLAYCDRTGTFQFKTRTVGSTTEAYHFYGPGYFSSVYGTTIKQISNFGPVNSKFYSRVQVKYREEDTSTSYHVVESSLTVAGNNSIWNYGYRTYSLENTWIPTTTAAETIAQTIFTNVSSLKKELEVTTSFIPQLDVLDIVRVSFDASGSAPAESQWDNNNWADTSGAAATSGDLVWDGTRGDSIKLNNKEFVILGTSVNLDNFECKFKLRET